MPNATVRANARSLPMKSARVNEAFGHNVPDDFIFSEGEDRSRFSPEFAALDREFSLALAEQTAAFLSVDGTDAGEARLAAATEQALEVKSRIDALELVYVKDTAVRMRAFMWELVRHSDRFHAEIEARIAAEKGRLQ
jgi:hypothetical protein